MPLSFSRSDFGAAVVAAVRQVEFARWVGLGLGTYLDERAERSLVRQLRNKVQNAPPWYNAAFKDFIIEMIQAEYEFRGFTSEEVQEYGSEAVLFWSLREHAVAACELLGWDAEPFEYFFYMSPEAKDLVARAFVYVHDVNVKEVECELNLIILERFQEDGGVKMLDFVNLDGAIPGGYHVEWGQMVDEGREYDAYEDASVVDGIPLDYHNFMMECLPGGKYSDEADLF